MSQSTPIDLDDAPPDEVLRSIVETPELYDFGEDFWHGCNPVGLDAAVDVDDADLLRKYRDLCADLPGDYFSDAPHRRTLAEDKQRVLSRIDALIERVEFAPRNEWPVDPEFVDFVADLALPSKTERAFDRQGWERVWDSCSADDLRFIRDALRVAPGIGRAGESGRDDVLTGLLHYHGEVEVEALFDVCNRGSGPTPEQVYANLDSTLDRLDPVIGAMVVHWIRSITTNVGDDGSGRYERHRTVNISTDGDFDETRARGGWENTTAHEVGHALHHLYGFWVGGETDNRERSRGEWAWNVEERGHDECSTAQEAFRCVVRQEWEKLRDGTLDPIETYQTKNADEFIAVAFECWAVDPDKLAVTQPRMKRLFDAHFGVKQYDVMQARLDTMPSPHRTTP